MDAFLRPTQGTSTQRRYIAAFIVILFMTILGAASYSWLLQEWRRVAFISVSPALTEFVFVIGYFSFVIILGHVIATKAILKRPFRSLVTPHARIQWPNIFAGALLVGVSILFTYSLTMLFFPHAFTFNGFSFSTFMIFAGIMVVTVPIQTTAEELFFRGFCMQWISTIVQHRPFIVVISVTLLFAGMHFWNPEMQFDPVIVGVGYLLLSFAYTHAVVLFDGLEFSIGAHAINNILLVLLFALETNAFEMNTSVWTVEYSSFVYVILMWGMNALWYAGMLVIVYRQTLIRRIKKVSMRD
ncbi:hypothetical protein CHL76_14615 [Marinococcus halophilus]|uniref:CAAX prenyl protease 2/Lysostaphin resistance protein A-like domain-containing protein n=1 Tax=Marinococcus halophilus TaxID=1371 RepID=A0A510YC63_MARHA|nr:CPBP family intramembrane glutamic endopeptidase [Marinococcus halophilus]OZT79049.1 hypothetical protein CHL76_14615 [Marinococcus halophilus]GEK59967.1 hypothetical protein MHA01_28720 [Marinococcus halophilus]